VYGLVSTVVWEGEAARPTPIPICMIVRPQHGVAFPDGGEAAYNRRMAARRINEPIEPMTLGNMRANGVRSLAVSCHLCHHETIISAARWADEVSVPVFGPRMVCTSCGIVGAKTTCTDARPHGRGEGRDVTASIPRQGTASTSPASPRAAFPCSS
jgi:hypothetical protein